jgi:RNA polymerase sigma factor (sigma-70 family)
MASMVYNLEKVVHAYQENRSSNALDEIIVQMDGLILSVIHQMLRSYRGMVDLEFDDLYQIGIVGLIKALATLPDGYDDNEIRMRVIAYVKSEINQKFRESMRYLSCHHRIMYDEGSVSDLSMHMQVEVKELFNLLIDKGVITRQDFYFLYHRFVEETSIRKLAEYYGKTVHGIVHWEQRLLNTLRHNMMVRGFES